MTFKAIIIQDQYVVTDEKGNLQILYYCGEGIYYRTANGVEDQLSPIVSISCKDANALLKRNLKNE